MDILQRNHNFRVKNVLAKSLLKKKEKNIKNNWIEQNLDTNEIFHQFIIECKKKTLKLINHDKKIFFYKDEINLLKKKESYNSGTQMNLELLLNMSEHDKNINIVIYNFMKYKFYRYFLPKFKNIERTELYINYITNLEINDVLNLKKIESISDNINWNKFFEKICKLNKFIKNFDCKYNKLEILKNLFNKKIITFFDFYEKIIQLIKILNYWILEDIIEIFNLIIKLFY